MEKSFDNAIILYQPDDTLALNVRVENESVWLNRNQIAELFGRDVKTIGKHVANALKEELAGIPVVAKFAITAADGKTYQVEHYNLEMITSIGYRVKSPRGVQFRIWANSVLKDYLLKGYSINQRLMQLEERIDRKFIEHDRHLMQIDEKIDFFVRSSLQPIEGVFFNGQILLQLSKRAPGVRVEIYTGQISSQLRQDTQRHNEQYPGITLHKYTKAHDRFLIIDEEIYHIGASLKDLGKKLFAFSKINIMTGSELIAGL